MRVGSSPISIGSKSATAPTTLRVFHSSDASPQPCRPGSSVSTLTKTQLRISALTTTVLTALIRIGTPQHTSPSAGPSLFGAVLQPKTATAGGSNIGLE